MSLLPPYDRPAEFFVHEEERGDRAFRVEVRPGMAEGQYLGLMVRCWGNGHWCVASGEPHHMTKREDALEAGERWLDEGQR